MLPLPSRKIFAILSLYLLFQDVGCAYEESSARQRTFALLRETNTTLLFVDREIARAESRREALADVVPSLAEARKFYGRALMLFENGHYDEAYGNSSKALQLAKDAFSKIPITKTENMNWVEAHLLLESANASVFFVDVRIAIAEARREKVTLAVPKLAEARRLLKLSSDALAGKDYEESIGASTEAQRLTQEALLSIGREDIDVSRILAALSSIISLACLLLLYSKGMIRIVVARTAKIGHPSSGMAANPIGINYIPPDKEPPEAPLPSSSLPRSGPER